MPFTDGGKIAAKKYTRDTILPIIPSRYRRQEPIMGKLLHDVTPDEVRIENLSFLKKF